MSTEHGRFELIDTESANLVGEYETEVAALRDVAESIDAYGESSPEVLSLALIRVDAPTGAGGIAAGADLVARARALFAPSGPLST